MHIALTRRHVPSRPQQSAIALAAQHAGQTQNVPRIRLGDA